MAIENVNIKYEGGARNRYGVPVKQWRKWGMDARRIFNELYSSMRGSQKFFTHPSAPKLSLRMWKTTAWNAAWIAAEAATKK